MVIDLKFFDFSNRYTFTFSKILKTLKWLLVAFFVFNAINLVLGLDFYFGYNFSSFINYLFLVIISSLGINAFLFFQMAHKNKNLINDTVSHKNVEKKLALKQVVIKMLIGLAILQLIAFDSNIKYFFMAVVVFSYIFFYLYKKDSENYYIKNEKTVFNNKDEQTFNFNPKVADEIKLVSNETKLDANSLKICPSIWDIFVKLASMKSDDEALSRLKLTIENFNKIFFNKEIIVGKDLVDKIDNYTFQELKNKIDIFTKLFYKLLHSGKKYIPMLILAYFVYLYGKIEDLEGKKYLREKLKTLVNHKNINTPKRMIELLLSWQYIKKMNCESIPSIRRLPKFFKKLLKKTLENYTPLTLKKSKMLRCSIKLKDLIKILHPKPKNNVLAVMYGAIIQDSKISKLKPSEHNPTSLKDDEFIINKINEVPINFLIRNIKNMNFNNDKVCLALEKRLKDVIYNINQIKRFVNIFDFYMPFFIVSKEDIVNISKKLKERKIKGLVAENFNINKIVENFAQGMIIDGIMDYLWGDFSKAVDIEKMTMFIEYVIALEKLIHTSLKSPNLEVIDIKFSKEVKNREKIKTIFDECLNIYFQNNFSKQNITIIIYHCNYLKQYVTEIAKAISFLTSKYPYYKLIVVGNKIEDYTQTYQELVKNYKPINKYLKTLAFLFELSNFVEVCYDYTYTYINQNKNEDAFLILDYTLDYHKSFFEKHKNMESKVIVYDYTSKTPGYSVVDNVYILSAPVDWFTFDIIDDIIFCKGKE